MTIGGDDPPQARIAPPAFLSDPAPAAVLAALPGARAVGGCVRDALAGRAVHDVDVAAPLPPAEIVDRLREAGLKVFETGLAHGTVTAVLQHQPVEVTALRRDIATDGRHAEVEWTTDWREDAARRDFSINAMSCDAAGNLWDYFGGREDLAAGRVRFVGDAATRLAEDYLRALRFFRFWARYGRGAADPAALAAIADAVEGFRVRIAPERIWMELKRLLQAPDPVPAIALMEGTGLRAAALPEAGPVESLRRLIALGAPADPLLRLAAWLPFGAGVVPGLARRLRLSGEERGRLMALCESLESRPPPQPSPASGRGSVSLGATGLPLPRSGGGRGWGEDDAALRRVLATRPKRQALDEAWLAEARDGHDRAGLRARIAAMDAPVFPLFGRDLVARGVPPGPAVGALLTGLKSWWLDSGCTATRAELLDELERRKDAGAADGPAAPAGGKPAGT
ncbi:CCA tRNA nucleotidyltransferase [Roseomonas sp. AR75]|uniref:CCA tRNA nucleotidyltransferase n=1 Tax=Roseomonas sp. AR75 TaxID=2562311 RepID=UPI001F0E9E4C|nr:CCA tRNA nucleotidyltransferase [Roseomonas sp. AR75]